MVNEQLYFDKLLSNFSKFNLIAILVLILISIYKKSWKIKELRIFTIYLILILFIDSIISFSADIVRNYYSFFENFLLKFKIDNTHFLTIFHYLTEILFLGLYFSKILKNKNIVSITIIYFISAILIYFYFDDYHKFGTVNSNLLNLFDIILPITYINYFFKSKLKIKPLSNINFLISLGILMPNLINLVFSFFAENLHFNNFPLYVKIKLATNFIDILGYSLFAFAFIKLKKQ